MLQKKDKYIFIFLESKPPSQVVTEDDDIMWTNLSQDIKEIIQMCEGVIDVNEARPYDPVSEISMEDQKYIKTCFNYICSIFSFTMAIAFLKN